MNRRAVLELSGLAAGVLTSGAVQTAAPPAMQAAVPPKRFLGSRVTTRDGVGLHFSDWGRGKVIALVHSWALNSQMWDYQVAAFTRAGWRCVVYDRRGHGRSDVPGWGYDYNTLADDLAAVIDSIGVDKVVLVAHSMGGGEVIRYLTRHGACKVERVVLLAPTAPGIARSSTNPTGVDLQIFETMRSSWRKDFPQWIDENTDPFSVADLYDDRVRHSYRNHFVGVDDRELLSRRRGIRRAADDAPRRSVMSAAAIRGRDEFAKP